jgi:hypothetical protein
MCNINRHYFHININISLPLDWSPWPMLVTVLFLTETYMTVHTKLRADTVYLVI